MVASLARLLTGWPARLLVLGLSLLACGAALVSPGSTPPLQPSLSPSPQPPQAAALLDRARLGTWYAPAAISPPASPVGYQESDFLYLDGQYYLFATGSQDPAWVDVYIGETPEDLVQSKPAFTHVAPIRYPTVVKEGDTWHMWGVNPPKKWTEHWISHEATPTGFVYADSPFLLPPPAQREGTTKIYPLKVSNSPVVDFAVRHNPADGYWYGVGFEIQDNAPLLLTRAAAPGGPWERLNYVPDSREGGVFGDMGAPPWANAARPDPNLAFTADGRAWIFFTGRPQIQQPPTVRYRSGVVEVDVTTGKALGNPVVLFDPPLQTNVPFPLATDLNFVSAPGQPDRLFGYTGNPLYPLAVLDVPDDVTPDDGRTAADLVRLDTGRGFGVAAGITPITPRRPVQWGEAGMKVRADDEGVLSYLDAAYLGDFTVAVAFTAAQSSDTGPSTIAYLGGPDYNTGAALSVQIARTAGVPTITAHLRGSDNSMITLDSGISPLPHTAYAVIVRRTGDKVTLAVNGSVQATARYPMPLTGLEAWSLAAEATLTQKTRYPFQGTIHSFTVTGSGS